MKQVFLVSWFTSENFGTCLQSYATDRVIKNHGYDVCFLDRRKYYPLSKSQYVVKKAFTLLKRKFRKTEGPAYGAFDEKHAAKIRKTNQFVKEHYNCINITSRKNLCQIDDSVVCYMVGSDQMWNPWMLSPHYLLDFVPKNSNKKKYSYAASFGVDNIPDDKQKLYKRYLPGFSKITVREPRAAELVEELSGMKAEVVLDPTFLLKQDEWREFAEESGIIKEYGLEKYVLCYFIGSAEFNHLDKARQIADELDAQLVMLPIKATDYKVEDSDILVLADACAYDFVALIDSAMLVCTDSFHAVVFSFLMGTAFYDFPRFKKGDKYSQEARLQNIMDKFALNDSYWNDELSMTEIENHLCCDYSSGYRALEAERKRSLEILYEMLDE